MKGYYLSEIAEALGCPKPLNDMRITVVLTDSRSLTFPRETLFFALVTERQSGHLFIPQLYSEGVRAFVVSETEDWSSRYPDATFLTVSDTLKALQRLASWHRQKLQMPILAITGSNGKTTTKELLYQILSPSMSVGRSPKSFNSQIGVALSLLELSSNQELGIIEAGISQPDEMQFLERMIKPTYGAITNIGEAHQQHFETLQQKTAEKIKLFAECEQVFAPYDNEQIRHMIRENGLSDKTVWWSRVDASAALFVEEAEYKSSGVQIHVRLKGRELSLDLPFLDQGTIEDTLLALLIASKIAPQVTDDLTIFQHLAPISMRLEVLEGKEDTLLINDTYSSDYDSLKIALDFMRRRNSDAQPTALVLSDMEDSSNDLGDLYKRVSELLSQHHLDRIYLVGENIKAYHSLFPGITSWYRDWESLDRALDFREVSGYMILVKGANTAQFGRVIENWKVQSHQTILSINLTRLTRNFQTLRDHLESTMSTICMIKANGYGAGAYEVAKTLERAGTDYLAVAVVDEGKELREKGIASPIMVMNPELSAFRQLIWYDLEPEIFSLQMLSEYNRAAEMYADRILPIHLKWNTGMNRLGLTPSELPDAVRILRASSAIRVESIFTHLAVADEPSEDAFTLKQLKTLDYVHQELETGVGYSIKKHALNTAGAIRFPHYKSDFVRFGIGLYGIDPLENSPIELEPIAELTTRILQVQHVKSGDTIGYGRRGKVSQDSVIGIIPVGYADGLPRLLGNGRISFRLADGTLVPTIGNICMDTTMLDLTEAPMTIAGTEVTLFGEDLPITRISEACDTIPYETLSRLSSRIARHYFSE